VNGLAAVGTVQPNLCVSASQCGRTTVSSSPVRAARAPVCRPQPPFPLPPRPEEPLRPPSQETTLLPATGPLPSAAAPAAPAAAHGNAGSFHRAATPGPGLVMSPGGVLSRRFRSSNNHFGDSLQEHPAGGAGAGAQ
jgi:hypothetical protein